MTFKITARNISYIALLMAINVVLTRVFSLRISFEGIEGIRIGFGHLPLIIAGIFLGAKQGFMVGALGDIIGFLISPNGFYVPTFTLVSGLSGVIPPLILKWCFGGVMTTKNLFAIIAFNQLLTALLFVPCLLKLHFGIPFWATMPGRMVSQVIMIPCFTLLTNKVIERLGQQKGLSTFSVRAEIHNK